MVNCSCVYRRGGNNCKNLYRIFSNRVRKWTEETETEIDDVIVDVVEEPISIAVVLLGFGLVIAT